MSDVTPTEMMTIAAARALGNDDVGFLRKVFHTACGINGVFAPICILPLRGRIGRGQHHAFKRTSS